MPWSSSCHGDRKSRAGRRYSPQHTAAATLIGIRASRAFELTEDPRWLDGVSLAWGWFTGSNDAGAIMFDVETGAGFDGLEADGRNENRGAESTLAALSTYQVARRHGRVRALATSR